MYEALLQSDTRPFRATPDQQFYFPSESIETARQTALRATLRAEGPVLILGGAGLGKSLLANVLAADLEQRFDIVSLHAAQLCSRKALLQNILFELEMPYKDLSEGELRLSILDRLVPSPETAPDGILCIVDEAHTLPVKLLDELRLITNFTRNGQPRARLILLGSLKLEDIFAQPQLDSFNQRLAARCYLQPLSRSETSAYVKHQLSVAGCNSSNVITDEALDVLFSACDGLPRLTNQIMDHAVVLAATQNQTAITPHIIEEAWADLQQLPAPWHSGEEARQSMGAAIEFGTLSDESAGAMSETSAPPESLSQTSDVNEAAVVEFEPARPAPALSGSEPSEPTVDTPSSADYADLLTVDVGDAGDVEVYLSDESALGSIPASESLENDVTVTLLSDYDENEAAEGDSTDALVNGKPNFFAAFVPSADDIEDEITSDSAEGLGGRNAADTDSNQEASLDGDVSREGVSLPVADLLSIDITDPIDEDDSVDSPPLEASVEITEPSDAASLADSAIAFPIQISDIQLPGAGYFNDRPTDEKMLAFADEQAQFDLMGVWENDPPLDPTVEGIKPDPARLLSYFKELDITADEASIEARHPAKESSAERDPAPAVSSELETRSTLVTSSASSLFGDDFEEEFAVSDNGFAIASSTIVATSEEQASLRCTGDDKTTTTETRPGNADVRTSATETTSSDNSSQEASSQSNSVVYSGPTDTPLDIVEYVENAVGASTRREAAEAELSARSKVRNDVPRGRDKTASTFSAAAVDTADAIAGVVDEELADRKTSEVVPTAIEGESTTEPIGNDVLSREQTPYSEPFFEEQIVGESRFDADSDSASVLDLSPWSVDTVPTDVQNEMRLQGEIEDIVSQLNFSAFSVEPYSVEQLAEEAPSNSEEDLARYGKEDEVYLMHKPVGEAADEREGNIFAQVAEYDDDRDLLIIEEDIPVRSTPPSAETNQPPKKTVGYSQLFAKLRR